MGSMERDKAAERFDSWSSNYEDSFAWRHYFMPLHDSLEKSIGGVTGKSVLDVGCGTGDMLRRFARAGAGRLVGADASEGMLSVSRELSAGEPAIDFVRASAEELPFEDAGFDLVISCIAFHHFPQPAASVAEMRRMLKPGGRLLIADLTDETLRGKLMLAYGKVKRADRYYFSKGSMSGLFMDAGFEEVASELIRAFPPTMLVTATK